MIETSFLLAIQERIAKNNNDSNICVERECNLPTAALLFPIRFFRLTKKGEWSFSLVRAYPTT
jgi:hypothetical protein